MKLAEVLAEASVPLLGVPRHGWSGHAFCGHVERGPGGLHLVHLVYLDGAEPPRHGAVVSTIDPRREPPRDDLDAHLGGAVARFDPAYVQRRVKSRRPAFPLGDFEASDAALASSFGTAGARLLRHRTLPLEVVRLAFLRGTSTADVAVACWDLDAMDFASRLEPVDPAWAAAFDADAGDAYPPPSWLDDPAQP